LEGKKAVVAEVAQVARDAHSAVAAEYRGLTVAQMTDLRVRARQAGVYVRVVRNTLARRALQDTSFECMSERLVGPLVFAFSQSEPAAAARVVRDFGKTNDKLVVRLASFNGQLIEASDLDRLASLPTRDEALSQLLSVMKAPVTKLAMTLKEPYAKLVRTVAAVKDQKQAA
jgi:large subunit ribosomal protein L10